jgi:Translation initiation factor eIF3 subunit 135
MQSFVSPQILLDCDMGSIDLAESFAGEQERILDIGSKAALLKLIVSRAVKLATDGSRKLSDALLEEAFKPSCILHTVVIPETACMLNCMVAVPLDSFGLTTFLHTRGVNIHCLGQLFKLSLIPYVKQLLLCEIIARSCKVYLAILLRGIGQSARDLSDAAEKRGRSTEEDFLDHRNETLEKTVFTIIDFFNAILGNQGADETRKVLWSDIIPRIIFSKFSLDVTNFSQHEVTFLPQLFNAMQYHTNIIFEKRNDYQFGVSSHPLSHSNFIDYVEAIKGSESVYYGSLSETNAGVDSLLSHRMFEDAMDVYRMRLSALTLSNPTSHSSKITATRSDLIHKIIMCKYHIGDYEGCLKALNSSIGSDSECTLSGARLFILAMCTEFRLGNIKKAMEHFESARRALTNCVGSDHPALALLFCSLGDLYYADKRLPQAKVMVMMAQELCSKVPTTVTI